MQEPRIRKPFPCAQCGYDLEGLPARGKCPECGLEIVASLARAVDGDAEEDATAPRAGAVARARGLFLACLSILLASLALGPVLIRGMDGRGGLAAAQGSLAPSPAIDGILLTTATVLSAAAAGGAGLGLMTFLIVMPIPTDGRSLLVRSAGLAAFALWGMLLAIGWGGREHPEAWALPAALALLATAPSFRELGTLSRVYRTRRAARQRIDLMLAAALTAGGAGMIARLLPAAAEARIAASVLAVAAGALFVFGAGYLTVNAWWILRAVTRPTPRVGDVLGQGDRRPPSAGSRPL